MDHRPILDKSSSQATQETASSNGRPKSETAPATGAKRDTLRFPGEDGGKSLNEMAQRDLHATLQLLAERAQYITGASGAAIALRESETMICRASAGSSAPDLGAELQIDSGLSAESVRTRKILRCDDAANDSRVNRESCRVFGIASVVVMPLLREEEVYGVFELIADRPRAFEERDLVALERLAEMIQTAVEHAEAAKRVDKLGGQAALHTVPTDTLKAAAMSSGGNSELRPKKPAPEPKNEAEVTARPGPDFEKAPALTDLAELLEQTSRSASTTPIEYGNLRTCEACGFPVSEGRKLCLDCEAANPDANPATEAPEFFSELSDTNASWLRSHLYLIATLLVVAATIAVLVWLH
jgi:putative methionine-R-sulfoxide reductase with GAF domain